MKSAAELLIKNAMDMTPKGRKDIAKWLRKCATGIVKDGHLYAERITFKYLYKD
jgi:hypothetical protein